jgi:hypothetical protein
LLKVFGIAVVAAVAALVLGVSVVGNTPSASADATAVRTVSCPLLAGAIDGDTTNASGGVADLLAACGYIAPGDPTIPGPALQPGTVVGLARTLGDKDSILEPSDLDSIDPLDGNQMREDCNSTAPFFPFCITLVFTFVNDERPVTIDNPSGLVTLQSPATTDFTCSTDGATLVDDNDCSDVVPANGDGVVIFHNFNAAQPAGADRSNTPITTFVRQEDVEQSFNTNVTGAPNNVVLTLVETTIGTSGNASNQSACQTGVDVTDAISPENATLAYAQVFDQDDRPLTMVSVALSIDPASGVDTIAALGTGNPVLAITGSTGASVDPSTEGAPIAFYRVICGGRGTGVVDIVANIDTDFDQAFDDDTSRQTLTVVGAPASVTLTAAPAEIACDGVSTSTVTAVIADSAGNPVADGTAVNFSVVALGTANPINTVTTGGQATSVITPLSNASAGVTVIVTAGDSAVTTVVQASTRVDCALPIETAPSPTVPSGTVTPPDTGTGGYADQDGGLLSLWTLVALTIGGTVLVAGGMVTRRAAK